MLSEHDTEGNARVAKLAKLDHTERETYSAADSLRVIEKAGEGQGQERTNSFGKEEEKTRKI